MRNEVEPLADWEIRWPTGIDPTATPILAEVIRQTGVLVGPDVTPHQWRR